MNNIRLQLLLFLLLSGASNAQPPELRLIHNLEVEESDDPWINQQTIIMGDAHSGQAFSRTDSVNPYGIGWRGPVPASFQNRNIHLSISGFARAFSVDAKASIVISILKQDSTVYWINRPVNYVDKTLSSWSKVNEEVMLPSNLCTADYTLLVYIWNENGHSICDFDDLSLVFNELRFGSFMPASDTVSSAIPVGEYQEVYRGKYFKLEYDKFSSQFKILSPSDKLLMYSYSLFTSWSELDSKDISIHSSLSRSFFLREDSLSEEGNFVSFDIRSEACNSKLIIFFSNTEATVKFHVESSFLRPVLLYRQSFSASYGPELREVYRNSSHMDTKTFQEEYWLGTGGFQVLTDSSGFILYRVENATSLQLRPEANRFCVNLDWDLDHPLLHWPLLKGKEKAKENHSSSRITQGDKISGTFSIHGINQEIVIPRLMTFSEGRTGAVIWTEHADYSDMKLQRAVNFGSDTIEEARYASAGFVKHRIPVTKSAFYSNPDKELNSKKLGVLNTEIANVKGTPGFKEFLLDVQNFGQEICLHTPDQYTTTRPLLKEALINFQKNFNSLSWIDHGYDNLKKSNREDLVCDGLNEASDYYALDLWQEFGLRYFWNCFYEDTSLYSSLGFHSFFSQPYRGWGDRFPVPDFWQHPNRSKELVHWATTSTFDPPDAGMWDYFFNEQRMEDLLQSRGIKVMHVYPARADSTNGFYEYKDGHFFIQSGFDSALQRQSRLRDAGRLELISVKDYFGYQMAIQKVKIRPLENGFVEVENNSEVDLKGISFAINSATVKVPGKVLNARLEDGETFFWFDLNKGESVNIEISPLAK
ncbi:MAG: hypothetical protein EYC69_06930 [Bacteroidetes bacterium]|nr:MAG: hypothetical protein EYC69_06930 [Bacteroidota bacterium]